MALRVAEAVVRFLAAALTVEGKLVETVVDLPDGDVVPHAYRLLPCPVAFHLCDSLTGGKWRAVSGTAGQ